MLRPPSIDVAHVRALAAHEADGAGGAGAHRDALQADALEIDLDGREAVLAVEEAGRRHAGAGSGGSTKPSSRARRTPISHSASSSSWCALVCTRWPEARPMRERAEATMSSARCVLPRRVLVVALGDRLGQVGQLAGHAAAAGDQQLAAVGDVAETDVRAPAAPAHAQQQEDEHRGSHRDDQPDSGSTAGAGPCGRRGGQGGRREQRRRTAQRLGGRECGGCLGSTAGWSRS